MKSKPKKQLPNKVDNIPFVLDKNHIYNVLVENDITHIDAGWKKFLITLESNIILDGRECNGVSKFDEKIVSLEISLEDDLAREILIHEYLHIMLETLAMEESNFSGGMIKTTNEVLVWGLTRMILLFKRLNPKLHSILFGE